MVTRKKAPQSTKKTARKSGKKSARTTRGPVPPYGEAIRGAMAVRVDLGVSGWNGRERPGGWKQSGADRSCQVDTKDSACATRTGHLQKLRSTRV